MRLLKKFTLASSGGTLHSRERLRKVVLSAGSSALARVISMSTGLITVPLTLGYLGVERYGLWMTISSLASFVTFADFGIGNGLINALGHAHGKDDMKSAQGHISSAFFSLTGIALFLGALFALIYSFIPWARVFNVKAAAAVAESGPAFAVFVACSLLSIPTGIIQKIHVGYQETYTNNIWMIFGNLLALAMLLLFIKGQFSLPLLVLAFTGAPLLANFLNGTVLFGLTRRNLFPRVRHISRQSSKDLLNTGLYFFVIQACFVVTFTTDNIVIAQVLGAKAVAEYAVPYKLFSIGPMLLGMMIVPLWPAYSEAIARGDIPWVRSTLRNSSWLALGCILPFSIMLTVFGPLIVKVWVSGAVNSPMLLLASMALQTIATTVALPLAMFLNGAGILKLQLWLGVVQAAFGIIAKIMLAKTIGVAGVPLATGLAQMLFWILPVMALLPRFFREIEAKNTFQPSEIS